jgi:hypothetical protein
MREINIIGGGFFGVRIAEESRIELTSTAITIAWLMTVQGGNHPGLDVTR